jgi:signal transduction histidine kinase
MRPSRWPIRARLTGLYAAAFLVAGAALVAATWWLVSTSLARHVDTSQAHLGSNPELSAVVRERIAAYRADTLDSLLAWSTLALLAALVLAIAMGWVLAGRALRPLHQVTATATRIAERNLHERIGLTGPDDEVKELADTIDAMLARLDRAFDAQRRFVANASHELRTPLTVNRTMLEVAVDDPDASDDLRGLAPRLLATNARSERMVDGLLTLARAELHVAERAPIDLADVAAAAVDQLCDEARARGIEVTTELQPALLVGSPVLVERLVANLVQNAVRHGSPGGGVLVRTSCRDGVAVVHVENDGRDIDPDEVDGLFEPFRRGNGRTAAGGVGLGLSIVRSVAQAHDGQVTARSLPGGGLVVVVALPTASPRS